MNFKVDQQTFLSELSLVMGAVENRATVPVTGMIQFRISGDNLIMTATNIDMAIKSRVRVRIDKKPDGEVMFVLPAARIYEWLSKAPSGELSCTLNKRFSAVVGKSRCSLAFPEALVFPDFPGVSKPIASVPADQIGPMFRKASVVVPNFEEGQFNYAGVHMKIFPDSIRLSATNGRRVAVCDLAGQFNGNGKSVLVAKKFALEVAKLSSKSKDGAVKIHLGENHVYFSFGDRLIYSRSLGGVFPAVEKVLSDDTRQSVISFSSEEAIDSLQRVATFSDQDSRSVTFEANGQLRFSSQSDTGEGDESIDAQYVGDPVSVKLNAAWVLDGLRAIEGRAEMRIISPNAPVEFRAAGDTNFRYVVAPMFK